MMSYKDCENITIRISNEIRVGDEKSLQFHKINPETVYEKTDITNPQTAYEKIDKVYISNVFCDVSGKSMENYMINPQPAYEKVT